MKSFRYIASGCFVVLAFFAASIGARASDFDGTSEAKVVWDITAGDEKIFTDRMGLIRETSEALKKRGIKPTFVLAIHGPAAKYVTKTLKGTKFENDKIEKFDAIQASINGMKNEGAKIEVCAIAMKRGKIEDKNVQPFAVVEENVWENIIVLQNKGYAYMPVF